MFSSFQHKNRRPYQEDRWDVQIWREFVLMLVCDGHGGENAAEFVVKRFPQLVILNLQRMRLKPKDALISAVQYVVTEWDNIALETSDVSGTTLNAILINTKTNEAHVVNLGDSMLFAYLDGSRFFLTKEHHPDDQYRAPAGCNVILHHGIWRITSAKSNTALAMTHSIGDSTLKDCLLRKPSYSFLQWENDLCILLATDGFWDVRTVANLHKQIQRQLLDKSSYRTPDLATKLGELVIRSPTLSDNVTILTLGLWQ